MTFPANAQPNNAHHYNFPAPKGPSTIMILGRQLCYCSEAIFGVTAAITLLAGSIIGFVALCMPYLTLAVVVITIISLSLLGIGLAALGASLVSAVAAECFNSLV